MGASGSPVTCSQEEGGRAAVLYPVRIWDEAGTFRVIYTARIGDAVVVLHAFQKKTQTTSKRDIELARARWSRLQER